LSTVSVILIAKNEEDNIQECLSTVSWANEIVVVDAGSSDATVAKAKTFTEKVFVRPWEGYGAAKNFALSQATSEWILWLDADERVSDLLGKEIQRTITSSDHDTIAYSVPRKANFLGRWILHCGWYPGRVTRLFKRGKGHFTDSRVHERLEIDGREGELASDLLHYTDPSLSHYFEKFNKYTSLAAEELADERRRFRISQITIRPVWTFIRMYFLKLGFLDGLPGFILCALSASYVFTKYAKLWEHAGRPIERRTNNER
jgi:glycosyltransferase involved in cell wall biosynthesis